MRKLLMGKLVRGIDNIKIEDLQPCDFCKQGKLPQGPHPVADIVNKGTRLLDLVVVDLAGPNRPLTLGWKLYDMVIVDTFTQRFFVILLAKKSDAAAELMRWIPRVEVQTCQRLHRLRSDNGESSLPIISPTGFAFEALPSRQPPAIPHKATGSPKGRTGHSKTRLELCYWNLACRDHYGAKSF